MNILCDLESKMWCWHMSSYQK